MVICSLLFNRDRYYRKSRNKNIGIISNNFARYHLDIVSKIDTIRYDIDIISQYREALGVNNLLTSVVIFFFFFLYWLRDARVMRIVGIVFFL